MDFKTDFCDWKVSSIVDIIRQNPLKASLKIPPIDHTLGTAEGNYIKINKTQKDVKLSFAMNKMTTISPYKDNMMCLKMWFYFGGNQSPNDYFHITTSERSSFKYNGKLYNWSGGLNKWLYTRFSFKALANDYLNITSQISSTNKGRSSNVKSIRGVPYSKN